MKEKLEKRELIEYLLKVQKEESTGLTQVINKYLSKEELYNLFIDIIYLMPSYDFYNFMNLICNNNYNDLLYINYELIISKLNEFNKQYINDYYFLSLMCKPEDKLNIIKSFMNYDMNYVKNSIIDNNLLKLNKNELNYLNNYICSSDHLDDLILNYFLKDYEATFPDEATMFLNSLDITYKIFLVNIVKDLMIETNTKFSDIKKVGHGTFSNVYQFRDKVLKLGIPRKLFLMANSKYILQPLVRLELKNSFNEVFATIEITQLVSTKNITVNEAKLLEKKMRKEKLVLLDHSLDNCGHLLKKNISYLNEEEFVSNAIFNGFDKNNKEYLDTNYKGAIIIDSDNIIRK